MSVRPLVLVALALPSLVACASPAPLVVEPPVARDTFPVTYEASVAGLSATDDLTNDLEDRLSAEAPVPAGSPQIEVGCELVRVDAETAAALFGWSPADGVARTVDMARIREILDSEAFADRISLVAAPSLLLVGGQRGTITICNQTAYISHFEVNVGNGMAVADPVVKVAVDGVVLDLLPTVRPGGLAVALDLVLELADLRRPIPVVEATMPGSSAPISFQQPILCTQTLTTSAVLTPGECLVLIAFDGEKTDGRLFAFLTARHIGREEIEALTSGTSVTPR